VKSVVRSRSLNFRVMERDGGQNRVVRARRTLNSSLLIPGAEDVSSRSLPIGSMALLAH
jgi:hypothetical protein